MTEQEKLDHLQAQIDRLLLQQMQFSAEINRLQKELDLLQQKPAPLMPHYFVEKKAPDSPVLPKITLQPPAAVPPPPIDAKTPPPKRDWEQYIGGNLINKIGIVILLIGLGLFVKYAIDQGFFPPLVRVICGYLAGLVLVGLARRFRTKYLTYSAVLFGGGMAVLYFTTYIGSSFFEPAIVPVLPSFSLMAVFMAITLLVAGHYNQQIIGLLGLVGAYAVPFLVNTGSENLMVFFAYITLINGGVLVLAAKKVWRTMTWFACILTWIIAFSTILNNGWQVDNKAVLWVFSIFSFQLFYAAILAQPLWKPKEINTGTYLLAGFNALFFYLLTLFLTNEIMTTARLTFLHALPHFGVAYLLWKKLDHKFPVTFFTVMGLIFLTGSIPLGFETNPVLWLWTAEAVILFFLARKYPNRAIEIFALSVGSLAILMLLGSWDLSYFGIKQTFPVILNSYFATQVVVLGGTLAVYFLNEKLPREDAWKYLPDILKLTTASLLYLLFFNEIFHWFDLQMQAGGGNGNYLEAYQYLWLFNYTVFFLTISGILNLRRWNQPYLATLVSIVAALLLTSFLTVNMQQLNYLRDEYLSKNLAAGLSMIGIRYFSYLFFAGLFWVMMKTIRQFNQLNGYEKFLPLLPHLVILIVLSHELVTFSYLASGTTNSQMPYREGFSILWGVYSLLLIGLGIWKKSKVLRLAGMSLFGITLFKVFFMDLVSLPVISRTLIFIGLGVLLLLTSFLYQKFKDKL